MDHLPHASNPVRPALDIPYICNDIYTYDNLEFATYPQRVGMDIERWRKNDSLDGRSLDEIAPFLQAWLFFGTLSEVFGIADIEIHIEDFIINRGGKMFITTANLHRYMWRWIASEARPGWHMSSDHPPRTEACIKLINSVTNDLGRLKLKTDLLPGEAGQTKTLPTTDPGNAQGHSEFLGHRVLLSAILLAEQLDLARKTVFWIPQMKFSDWEFSKFGKSLLKQAGWCLGEIYMLGISEASVLFYISSFNRHLLGKDHSACSDVLCVANQINEAVYQTKHVDEACNCEHMVAEGAGKFPVTEILKEGGIPVISLQADRISSIETLVVENAHDSKPYVAISHAWSDGMGNPNQNSLPICQLRRLQKMVNDLYEPKDRPVPFWVDTICVPLSPSMRSAAIRRMAKTYEGSDKVLVLDASLRNVSVESSSDELLVRIRCSGWTQRLWTLQEGMMAKELYFQFAGGPVQVEPLRDRFYVENTPVKLGMKYFGKPNYPIDDALTVRIYRALASDADEYISDEDGMEAAFTTLAQFPDCPTIDDDTLLFRLATNGECSNLHRIFFSGLFHYNRLRDRAVPGHLGSVVRALIGRQSSKMEDETICLATLLGIDPVVVLKIPGQGQERMKALLRCIEKFPPSILFSNVPRIEDYGYRWAPASFMTGGAIYQGLLRVGFDSPRTDKGLRVTNYFAYLFPEGVKLPSNKDFLVRDPVVSYTTLISPRDSPTSHTNDDFIHRSAIILENSVNPFSRGVLVSVLDKAHDGALYVRYESNIHAEQYNEQTEENIFQVKGLGIRQIWYVG